MKLISSKYQRIAALAAVMVVVVTVGSALGVSRTLAFNWNINDSKSYTYDTTVTTSLVGSGTSSSQETTSTLEYTVVQQNADQSYSLNWEAANTKTRTDGGSWITQTAGADTEKRNNGCGKLIKFIDEGALFPFSKDPNWNCGDIQDVTGCFPSVAVDVNDCWTQTIQVKPYGATSWQGAVINWQLIEWTTLNGHNVAKIHGTSTVPINLYNSSTGETLAGNMSMDITVYYAYGEKFIVELDDNASGTLSRTVSGQSGVDYLDLSTQSSLCN